MKKVIFLVPLAVLALSACGYSVFDAADDMSGSEKGFKGGKGINTNAATTGAFTKLEALGPDNIIFVTGDSFSIKAQGNDEAMARIRYKVKDDTIMIGREKGKFWGKDSKAVVITVTAPTLAEASLVGSGNFNADKMSGEKIVLKIAGSGNLTVGEIDGKQVEGKIAGSGDVKLAGKVERAEYEVAGSGSIDAFKLASTNADVSIAGSGDIRLTATGKVDASIAGSGNVSVAGGAKCTSSTIGSGRISCT